MDEIDFKLLFESAPSLYLILKPDLKIATASPAYLSATMTSLEEIQGRHLFDVFPNNPDDPTADGVSNLQNSLNYVLKNKKPHGLAVQKYDIRCPDGTFEERYWSPLNTPALDSYGEVVYIIHRVDDVTEFVRMKNEQEQKDIATAELVKKVADMEMEIFLGAQQIQKMNFEIEQKIKDRTEELSNSEKKYRYLFENNPMPMCVIDMENFKFLDVNEAAVMHFGYTREEFLSMTAFEIRPDEDKELFKKFDRPEKGKTGSYNRGIWRNVKKDGTIISVETFSHEITIAGKPALLVLSNDVTERLKAEKELNHSLKEISEYKDLLNDTGALAKIGGWEINLADMTVNWTAETGNIHELPPGVMPPVAEAINFYAPEARPVIQAAVNHCIVTGEGYDLQLPFITAKGKNLWVRAIGKSERQNGKTVRVYGVFQDITEQKKTQDEIIKLNEELEQKINERTVELQTVNKELEAFTYSVSHDLRAPLRAINGFAKMLNEDYSDTLDDGGKRMIDVIQTNAKNMGNLIDDLLAFSRLGRKELSKSLINMTEMAKAAIDEINKSTKHNAKIKINELHPVMADNSLIKQVLVNLFSNGIKYSSKSSNPFVEISSMKSNGTVYYTVKDNGIGFDMKYSHKLFMIFERLHSESEFEGTGVGLALVKRIIQKHGGEIRAEAKINEGAVFHFMLPEK